MNTALLIIEIIVLLCCAAFFSGSETAITAVSRPEYRVLKQKKQKNAKRLARLIELKEKIVTVTLIGTNFVNTLNSSLITAFTLSAFGAAAVPAATAVITVLIIIAAEIFPKALAAERPVQFGKAVSLPLSVCYILLLPAALFFSFLSKGVLKLVSQAGAEKPAVLHKKDLQLLVHIGQEDGALGTGEHALLERAVFLQHIKLRNIMTPRTKIAAIAGTDCFEDIITQFRSSGFSRLPVYDSDYRSITGVIHYKDLLFALQTNRNVDCTAMVRPAVFISDSASIFSAIKTMNLNARNMLIVIDEYGGIAGLITMDDIIAVVFSHTQDEYSKPRRNPLRLVRLQGSNTVYLPGDLRLEDCNTLLHTHFSSNYYDTLGGFLLEQWGCLPEEQAVLTCGAVQFTVTGVVQRRIAEVSADIVKA